MYIFILHPPFLFYTCNITLGCVMSLGHFQLWLVGNQALQRLFGEVHRAIGQLHHFDGTRQGADGRQHPTCVEGEGASLKYDVLNLRVALQFKLLDVLKEARKGFGCYDDLIELHLRESRPFKRATPFPDFLSVE